MITADQLGELKRLAKGFDSTFPCVVLEKAEDPDDRDPYRIIYVSPDSVDVENCLAEVPNVDDWCEQFAELLTALLTNAPALIAAAGVFLNPENVVVNLEAYTMLVEKAEDGARYKTALKEINTKGMTSSRSWITAIAATALTTGAEQ